MTNITNNHTNSLDVGSVTIRPGATAKVPEWDSLKSHGMYKAWHDAGIISAEIVSDESKEPEENADKKPVASAKRKTAGKDKQDETDNTPK